MEENKNIPPKQPAENIPEVEQSEILPSGAATTASEENILPEAESNTTNEQLSTINSQFSTEENMEVHHHTHPYSHRDHGKKNWKSYFYEFLMLFLAVTLGFFVENQREHFIEHQRAKRFAASLFEDLQADTAEIHMNSTYIKNLFLATDSVLAELDKPRHLQNDTILQLRGTRRLLNWDFFDPQMGNYEQIKNSGALRYFSRELVKKMTFYESRKNRLVLQKQEYVDFNNTVITPFSIKMANAKFLDTNTQKLSYKSESVFITKPDKEILIQWQNMIIIIRQKLEEHKIGIGKHKLMALEIMGELRKEYHLE